MKEGPAARSRPGKQQPRQDCPGGAARQTRLYRGVDLLRGEILVIAQLALFFQGNYVEPRQGIVSASR